MKRRFRLRAYCYDSKGRLISTGENNYGKSHPLQAYWAAIVGQPERIYLHAEVLAILRAKDREIFQLKWRDTTIKVNQSYHIRVLSAGLQ